MRTTRRSVPLLKKAAGCMLALLILSTGYSQNDEKRGYQESPLLRQQEEGEPSPPVEQTVVPTEISEPKAQESEESSIRFLLSPEQSATISVGMDGRVVKLLQPGDRFKKGEIILAQECGLYKAEKGIAEAEREAVRLKMETNRSLAKRNAVSQFELKQSEIEYEKAREGVKRAKTIVEKCNIRAPFDGQVAQTFIKRYEHASNSQPALEIYDDNNYELTMIVPSAWLKWLNVKQEFNAIFDETGETHKAYVSKIGSRIDAVSKTVPISAILQDKPRSLIYGMSGEAQIKKP